MSRLEAKCQSHGVAVSQREVEDALRLNPSKTVAQILLQIKLDKVARAEQQRARPASAKKHIMPHLEPNNVTVIATMPTRREREKTAIPNASGVIAMVPPQRGHAKTKDEWVAIANAGRQEFVRRFGHDLMTCVDMDLGNGVTYFFQSNLHDEFASDCYEPGLLARIFERISITRKDSRNNQSCEIDSAPAQPSYALCD